MEVWADDITNIKFAPDLGASPAQVNRITGEMTVSLKYWNLMPPCHRLYVMLHEKAHIKGQTKNEDEADAIAYEELKKLGKPLDCGVFALTELLNMKNPEHRRRAQLAYKRFLIDIYINSPIKQNKVIQTL